MSTTLREAAVICSALEVLPAAPRDLSYLLEELDSYSQLFGAASVGGSRAQALHRYLASAIDKNRVRHWEIRLTKLESEVPDLRYLSVGDPGYPASVRRAYDRPPLLFSRGTIPDGRATALVGSRRCSPEAQEFTIATARQLVAAGHAIVSGLAAGTDGLAHEAGLQAGGYTIAALGHALDVAVYPAEHEQLASRIVDQGALVSQFRPGAPPTASSFLQRNALISAFAEVSVVVAAGERSGSRSELDAALAQNRVVVLPGFAVKENAWMRALAEQEERVHVAHDPSEVVEIATQVPLPLIASAG